MLPSLQSQRNLDAQLVQASGLGISYVSIVIVAESLPAVLPFRFKASNLIEEPHRIIKLSPYDPIRFAGALFY